MRIGFEMSETIPLSDENRGNIHKFFEKAFRRFNGNKNVPEARIRRLYQNTSCLAESHSRLEKILYKLIGEPLNEAWIAGALVRSVIEKCHDLDIYILGRFSSSGSEKNGAFASITVPLKDARKLFASFHPDAQFNFPGINENDKIEVSFFVRGKTLKDRTVGEFEIRAGNAVVTTISESRNSDPIREGMQALLNANAALGPASMENILEKADLARATAGITRMVTLTMAGCAAVPATLGFAAAAQLSLAKLPLALSALKISFGTGIMAGIAGVSTNILAKCSNFLSKSGRHSERTEMIDKALHRHETNKEIWSNPSAELIEEIEINPGMSM